MAYEKVRENRLRRMLDRRGFKLVKSRRRDTEAWDFGSYIIIDQATGLIVEGGSHQAHLPGLEDVEAWLKKPRPISKDVARYVGRRR
jgi:hypothetical protein